MAAGKKKPEEKKPDTSGTGHSLRDEAEEQLARSPKPSPGSPVQTPEALIHELQVHQIELEIQAEELRKSKLALEESRDKYLGLYDFAPLGYFTLNDKALITAANLTGAKLLLVERSRLVNAPFSKFVADNDAGEWHWYFMNVLNQKEKRTCTLMLKRGGGPLFPAQLEAILIPNSDGVNTVRVAIIDITESRRAEDALRVSQEQLTLAIEGSGFGLWDWDVQTGKTVFNEKWAEIAGYTLAELSPVSIDTWINLCHPDDLQQSDELLKKHFSKQSPMYVCEARIRHKDGHWVWVLDRGKVVNWDSNGLPIRMTGTHQDITERKELEKEMVYHAQELQQYSTSLAAANKKLTLLSGITRHDINNQLLVLNGFLGFLQMKVTDPTLEDYFTKITKASERIAAMIQFTKEYEKIGVNAPVWQDCRKLVDIAAKQTPLGKIMVKNDLPVGIEVFADPLIVKVFYNLMDNAVRYGGKITTIRFSEEEHNGDQIIVCEDDGDGVVAEEKEKIFERGYGKNTGMGLFLAREILDITGITIRETSEPGKGARFEIMVPKGAWRTTGTDD
ncbi:MAG: PAS domain-containing protein [Methanoregula sp.]|nr:PAS domain-containing protein [Methanoregula sp.]